VVEPDVALRDGFELEPTEFRLTALHTPGHASDHLCYLLERTRLLFSGDHVMQGSTVVIRPPDGDMAAYLESLRRLLTLRVRSIAPGHGFVIEDPTETVEGYLAHRDAREAAVLGALAAGDRSVDEIVRRVYVDVADELHPVARHSVYAHLLKLVNEGRARGSSIEGAWEAADSK
jgi:glyoxylase-like metal-dependent hydrolase (beta-lactamase superfamily II)